MRQNSVGSIEQMCYYLRVMARKKSIRLLRLAVESQRWDLAAHTIVLATARILNNGEKPHASGSRKKEGITKG